MPKHKPQKSETLEGAPSPLKVRVLLGVVIGMGVLLLVGFVVVAVTIVSRASGGGRAVVPVAYEVVIPNSGGVVEMETAGNRLILRTKRAVIITDIRSGEVLGRIGLE
ncbi:MAG: hypothetical protein ACR2N8_04995 [Parvibaculales bacterium]